MKILDFIKNKYDCVGCTACMASCPVGCIEMKIDEEGFYYPIATDKCIKCGKCEKVCPIVNYNTTNRELEIQQKAYCAVTKDKNIWKRSASGGAFSEICRVFGDSDTIVCGATWDGFKVHHVCIKGVENITQLCKSKYVASYPDNVFNEIKSYLKNSKKVIFCGTPCQVAGLKAYLGKEYDNLLLIDLICHGAGSPKVFEDCINYLSNYFGKEIKSYEFRHKNSKYESDYIQQITFTDGTNKMLIDDPYIQLFLSQLCLRLSCGEHCLFRNEQREGDLTIADFKGVANVFPELRYSNYNYSTIVSNSLKGEQVVNKLDEYMNLYNTSIDNIKKYNPLFYRQTWFAEDRNKFFEDYTKSANDSIIKYTKPFKVHKITFKRKVYFMLSPKTRCFIADIKNKRK